MTLITHLPRVHTPADDRLALAAARKLLSGIPDDATVQFVHAPDADLYALELPATRVGTAGELPSLRPEKVKRWMTLDRPPLYWMSPKVGKVAKGKVDYSSIVQGQMFLAETGKHRYTLLLPLVGGDLRASLRGKGDTLTLAWEGRTPPAGDESPAELLLIAEGHEPYSLVRQVMAALRDRMGTFRLAEEKHDVIPHGLGWCTWDAFYGDVDEGKLLAGLRSFREKGIPLGWCILDDGWLDNRGEKLVDFPPNKMKFPRGLGPVIEQIKSEGLAGLFGIWHAFEGYWCGIDPDGPLGQRYRTIENSGNIRPWNPGESRNLRLIHPDDAHRFYHDFHAYLRAEGVDLVKVDGQSAVEVFTQGVLPRASTMQKLQLACQASALLHFGGRMIHCMGNGSDVVFNLLGTSLFRNSDDFFPNRTESHGRHLFHNALNAVWTHTVAVPDWDMFWSTHPEAGFHAAARALSGGPVYVSDQPGTQDANLLWSLLDDCGMVLPVDRAGLPRLASLFQDPTRGDDLLVVTNTTGHGHLLAGVFNCMPKSAEGGKPAKPITTTVYPTDVPEYDDGPVVAHFQRSGKIVLLAKPEEGVEVTLAPLEWEIVTFAPLILPGLAAIGLSNKFLAPAAIVHASRQYKTTAVFRFHSGGPAVFHAAKKPKDIELRGAIPHRLAPGDVVYNAKTKALVIELPHGGDVAVAITI